MESPELEQRSSLDPTIGGSGAGFTSSSRRGPNPNRDYKQHFNRQKQLYDAVTSDQNTRKKELNRASQKQIKLQEEIEFLLDAIAGERHRRQLFHDGDDEALVQERAQRLTDDDSPTSALDALTHAAAGDRETDDVKPSIVGTRKRDAGDDRAAVATSTLNDDKEYAGDSSLGNRSQDVLSTSSMTGGSRRGRRTDGDTPMVSAVDATAPTGSSNPKRQRPSPSASEEEWPETLEAADLPLTTKRMRH